MSIRADDSRGWAMTRAAFPLAQGLQYGRDLLGIVGVVVEDAPETKSRRRLIGKLKKRPARDGLDAERPASREARATFLR